LGHRAHANFCENPCVLEALIDLLLHDECWLVRKAAATSIFGQRAFTPEALMALYISSKVDPHYYVRKQAADMLDLLTLCHKCCYKCLYESGDKFIKELKTAKYKAGATDSRSTFAVAQSNWLAASGGTVVKTESAPVPAPAPMPLPKVPEGKPGPTEAPKKLPDSK
jgi:hypothetical protein